MYSIEMVDYRKAVETHKVFFNGMNEKITILTKDFARFSKEYNNNRVLDVGDIYEGVELGYFLDKLLNNRPKGLLREVLVWFVLFDGRIFKKINKKSFSLYIRRSIDNEDNRTWFYEEPGLFSIRGYQDRKSRMSETKPNVRYSNRISPINILIDFEKGFDIYEEGMSYLIDNKHIFPKIIQRRIEKGIKSSDTKMKILLNDFQYQVYKGMLPNKIKDISERFVRDELKRFMLETGSKGDKLKTSLYCLNALIENYGVKDLKNTKYFLKIINTFIIQGGGAENFSKEEIRGLFTDEIYYLMNLAMVRHLGVGLSDIKETQMKEG